MRRGGRPSWYTAPGWVKSAAVTPAASIGAPKRASTSNTRWAFAGVGRTKRSMSPLARGTPWKASA